MKGVLAGLDILLIEDDYFILEDLRQILECEGANVTTAMTVHDGMMHVDRPYNAAVLDIRLPDGEVFGVADGLAAANTPLIFHSGNVETAMLSSRFPSAVALSKPAHDAFLVKAVKDQAMRKQRQDLQ